jgi:hypothetical protein
MGMMEKRYDAYVVDPSDDLLRRAVVSMTPAAVQQFTGPERSEPGRLPGLRPAAPVDSGAIDDFCAFKSPA